MKAWQTRLVLLSVTGLVVALWSSGVANSPGAAGSAGPQAPARSTIAQPDGTYASQQGLGGFVAIWTMRGPAVAPARQPAPAEVQAVRAALAAAHAREVAQVSVRMLELQARQDPARAAYYLAQAAHERAHPYPAPPQPSRQQQALAERQRQVNQYMSAKIDQLIAAQGGRSTTSGSGSLAPRPGDVAGPRPGDTTARSP